MTILIPAYQPDARMTALVRELRAACGHRILIADDGSGPAYDALFQEAREAGCTVLRFEANRGKGAALKHGFAYLLAEGEPAGVVCADCDGQHTAADILRLADIALANPGVMVLGRRDFSGGSEGVPARSLIGNTATRIAFALIVGVRVYDVNTGLRAYSADMLESLTRVPGDRFEYEMNLLTRCRRLGFRVMEEPIATVYERGAHTSHFRTFTDALRVGAALARFALSALAAFGVDMAVYGAIAHFGYGIALWRVPSGPADPFALYQAGGVAAGLFWAVAAARLVSGTLNYTLNRRLVFGGGTRSSPVKYILLAVLILAANYWLQLPLIGWWNWPAMPAKLLAEAVLFAVSFLAQRTFVFREKR
ncbi:MAG: bifunctional glycosyltransferase family 2/GtrA family protein [Oscillospiraceae bacterium]|nr:bifunctional glycosyltransferase family 2/GtrA family protein [Oscillospiraceae bacterium]